jgi:hypothetical protein
VLVTRATRDRLRAGSLLRWLGGARVVNAPDSIELFELCPLSRADAGQVCSACEAALAAFEAGEFRWSTSILGRLVSAHGDDGPSFALLAHAIAHLVDGPEAFARAFRLPGK